MRAISAALLALTASAVVSGPAAAAPRADLRVSKLSEPPAALQAGATLMVADTVRNAGRGKARKTAVVYWLSADRRRNAGDVRAGRRSVKPLKGRRSARGRATLTLPAALAAGAYHLIACADGTGKVKERSERDNCRASRGRLAVTPLALPGQPALPGPTPAPATPAPTATPTPAPAPGTTPRFPMQPDPLTVTHTKESDRAVTREILGGFDQTITATGSDGTVYTLLMPAGAILSKVDVTLTPISAVEGSPLSGELIGAVEILPHGLQLMKPATLTIDPPGETGDVTQQTGFLSHDEGEDFHLYPLGMGGEITMSLTHFSTPGVANASAADREAALRHPPIRERAQMEQLMGEAFQQARAAGEGLPQARIAVLMGAYYEGFIGPLAEQALADDSLAEHALGELVSWGRHVDLFGVGGHAEVKPHRDRLHALATAIMENAIAHSYTRCVELHELEAIARIVRLGRMSALLGITLSDESVQKVLRCPRFEVDFDSLITQDYTLDGFNQDHVGKATWNVLGERVPLEYVSHFVNGSATLAHQAFSYEYTITYNSSECSRVERRTGVATQPDESVLFALSFDVNLHEPGAELPPDRNMSLRISGYDGVEETYQESTPEPCGGPVSSDQLVESRWADELGTNRTPPEFREWQLGAGDLVASKLYTDSQPSIGIAESTRVEVWHAPETD